MRTVYILEDDDIVLSDDWMRPLDFDGSPNTRSVYSGTPENNTKWIMVCEYFGDWVVGKTVKKIHKKMNRHDAGPLHEYEFIRGFIPHKHTY